MAVLPLCQYPHPVLRQKARRVPEINDSIRRLVADMIDTMRHNSGVGLAAPQVGVPLRVMVIELPEQAPIVLINPEVVKRRGERQVEEGCLSYPGYKGELQRSESMIVKGLNLEGQVVRVKGEELLAQALEHELDHLNGVLYIDHLESEEKLHKIEPPAPPQEA